ncbi:MAG: M14 family metallopeptidase [candidate division Zixibacteria bacterium]|nr:M14 family metallopeptidase [candidate division Zixibacteria bacterium]MDH3938983.1 M14 family metallopeptidase [candidate division Zixibacteria bacterium]MDH4035829.1 M14 family metallopeptidase [candidate division Zixibacteria bacterium]
MIAFRIFLTLALLVASTASATKAGKLTLSFDHYFDGPEMTRSLEQLNAAYPNLTELRIIGTSEEGRDIHLLTINNNKTGKDTEKPGVYVDGTIHGNEVQAAEVCLYLAWYLLESYDSNESIKELVDSRAFYIIPVVNVDQRWRFFTDAGHYNKGRTAMVPYDDDRDGLADEDSSEDLDGDGEILRMRVADPFGGYKTHPDDPRVMVRVEPGEIGQWRRLGSEGIDNDGDGRLNEDGPGYLDMNRNYGFKWQPPYVQSGAGDFPMSSKPTKATSDFIITKPNICFNFAFHNSGGMWVRGPGSKLAGFYPPSDVKVYDFLGKEGEKITPGYDYIIGGQDMYTTHGDFDEWMFSNNGIFGFVGELFMSEQERYRKQEPKKSEDEDDSQYYGGTPAEERQLFSDNLTQGEMYTPWKKFDHPQFGEVEIGGWRTFTTRMPPPFLMLEMVHRNASMVIFTARHAPVVSLELLDVTDLGGGLKRVRVRASNRNAIPTLSSTAVRHKIYRKDILRIDGVEVVSGGIIEDRFLNRVSSLEHRPHMIFTSVPSFGRRDVQWIVRGKGKAKVTFEAIKARNKSLTIDL